MLLGIANFNNSPTVVGIIFPSVNDKFITWSVVTWVIGMVKTICLAKPENEEKMYHYYLLSLYACKL